MKKYMFSVFVIVLALALGQQVLSLWMGTVLAQKGLSKEDLLKAIRLTPDNPGTLLQIKCLSSVEPVQHRRGGVVQILAESDRKKSS